MTYLYQFFDKFSFYFIFKFGNDYIYEIMKWNDNAEIGKTNIGYWLSYVSIIL